MPRPVVPMRDLPRKRSVTLSMATWYGMIKCASAEISSLPVSTPLASRPAELLEQHAGVDHHAVADHVGDTRRQDPRRDEVQREVLAVGEHDGVPGVVAALVAHDPLDLLTEDVGGLALALVTPLGADEDDGRHVTLPGVDSAGRTGVQAAPCSGRVVHACAARSSSRGRVVRVVTCGDAARRALGPAAGRRTARPWHDLSRPARRAPTSTRARRRPGDARLVVAGDDAALAAVLVRLLRRERLDVAVALLPAPDSAAAGRLGPARPTPRAALALARDGARATRRRWCATTTAAWSPGATRSAASTARSTATSTASRAATPRAWSSSRTPTPASDRDRHRPAAPRRAARGTRRRRTRAAPSSWAAGRAYGGPRRRPRRPARDPAQLVPAHRGLAGWSAPSDVGVQRGRRQRDGDDHDLVRPSARARPGGRSASHRAASRSNGPNASVSPVTGSATSTTQTSVPRSPANPGSPPAPRAARGAPTRRPRRESTPGRDRGRGDTTQRVTARLPRPGGSPPIESTGRLRCATGQATVRAHSCRSRMGPGGPGTQPPCWRWSSSSRSRSWSWPASLERFEARAVPTARAPRTSRAGLRTPAAAPATPLRLVPGTAERRRAGRAARAGRDARGAPAPRLLSRAGLSRRLGPSARDASAPSPPPRRRGSMPVAPSRSTSIERTCASTTSAE